MPRYYCIIAIITTLVYYDVLCTYYAHNHHSSIVPVIMAIMQYRAFVYGTY